MPLSTFGRSRWFGDDEEDQPTSLFPQGGAATESNSLFPTKSDSSPILSGLKSGWKGLGDWLNGPADSDAGSGGDLLGYKPTNRWGAISDALGGAAKGVLHARGPYSNWFGEGLLGATEGLESSRAKDLKLRSLAQEQQYKSAAASLAAVRARTAEKQAEHAGEYTIGRTRYDPAGKPIVTAPPEEMSEADKARIAQGDQRLDLDRTLGEQRIAQDKAQQAEAARYHGVEAGQGAARLKAEQDRLALDRQTAGLPKSEPERDRAKLLELADKVRNNSASPAEIALYERMHRKEAEPKESIDPVTGGHTTVRPDLTDLPPPPSQAGQPQPAPGVTQTPELFPRAQLEESGKKYTAFRGLTDTVAEMKAKLAKMSASERFSSDDATQLGVMENSIISAIGAAENAGVVQTGESDRFKATLGPITGGWAAANKITGLDRVNAALDAVLGTSRTSLNAAAPEVSGADGAKKMQLGVPFRFNGHLVVKHGPDEYAVIE